MRSFSAPPSSRTDQRNVEATVKWFNPDKGFGFVALSDSDGEAFLHISALERSGFGKVGEGARMICDIADGQKGPQVAHIHSLDTTGSLPPGVRSDRPDRGERRPPRAGGFGDRRSGGGGGFAAAMPTGPSTPPHLNGTVKFYNAEKGFGFIAPEDGSGDVFLHATALQRSGITRLDTNQGVRYSARQGRKGVEVDQIELS
jgi:cold shock protein